MSMVGKSTPVPNFNPKLISVEKLNKIWKARARVSILHHNVILNINKLLKTSEGLQRLAECKTAQVFH